MEHVLLGIIANKELTLAILNGLTHEYKLAEDKHRKNMFKEAISDVLRSLEHLDWSVRIEPFKTYADLIHYNPGKN